MIKKLFFACSILFFAGCGLSQEEIDKQQRIDDSLMEIERVSIIDKANQQLLNDTTVTDSIKADRAIKKTKK